MEPAANVTQKARQERDHRPGHACHLDQVAKEHEQRNRKENETRHSLVHAPEQHLQRRLSGQRQVAESGESEGEGDWRPGEHRRPDHTDKKNRQVQIAQPLEQGSGDPKKSDDGDNRTEREDDSSRRSELEPNAEGRTPP